MPAKRPAARVASAVAGGPGAPLPTANAEHRAIAGPGWDTEGKTYSSLVELWSGELGDADGRRKWYAKGAEYWKDREVSLDGILGGYGVTHEPDVKESRRFLEGLRGLPAPPAFEVALDAGAGIGRVAKSLLQDFCQTVDMVEPNDRFLDAARKALPPEKVGRCEAKPLQLFEPDEGRYDLVWAQGVLLYLPDDDLVRFLDRCKLALRKNGVFCVKDNVSCGKFWVDREDNSIARTDEQMQAVFARAGMELVRTARQEVWPEGLLPVVMYAFQPAAQRQLEGAEAAQPSADEAGEKT